nr:hypothetical protein [Tanacetum cinerariifolium]
MVRTSKAGRKEFIEGDKGKSDKGLVAESFDWDDEYVSLEDEGTTKFKAFMEIAEDEPSVRKGDARSGQWDEISDLKKVIEKWTCSKVTLDQLLSEQIPRNIIKALGGKGKRKKNNSKEVLFTKADVSTFKSTPMITSDSEDSSDNQKKTKPKHPAVQNSCPDKNALPSTEQLRLTLMEEVKGNKGFLSSNQNLLKSGFTKGTDMCKNAYAGLPKEESGPKVVFRDNSSGDKESMAQLTVMESHSPRQMENLNDTKFWGKALNDTCYTQNRSIIVKRHKKTAYEVFRGRAPDISYFYVFGCPVHIHNHIDHLRKFNEKADDGFFLGYSLVAKAFRVFNIRRKEMKENFHVTFSEENEAISQTSTEGDDINFNKANSFLDDEFTLDEVVHPEPAATFESIDLQEDDNDDAIDDQPLLQVNLPLADSISGPLVPRDRQIRDSEAASADECLYVNFLSKIEPKKLMEALKEEGWVLAMTEELNQFERNKVW